MEGEASQAPDHLRRYRTCLFRVWFLALDLQGSGLRRPSKTGWHLESYNPSKPHGKAPRKPRRPTRTKASSRGPKNRLSCTLANSMVVFLIYNFLHDRMRHKAPTCHTPYLVYNYVLRHPTCFLGSWCLGSMGMMMG